MKWVLVDKYDNINTSAELHSGYGKVAAKAYFLGVKKTDEKSFDELWRVMTYSEYDIHYKLANRQDKQVEWWKEEESYLDIEAPMTQSGKDEKSVK